jgi:hypothetical protein
MEQRISGKAFCGVQHHGDYRRSFQLKFKLSRSMCALAQQHDLHSVNNNQQVKKNAAVFYVVQIILQLFEGILQGVTVFIANLGPAG